MPVSHLRADGVLHGKPRRSRHGVVVLVVVVVVAVVVVVVAVVVAVVAVVVALCVVVVVVVVVVETWEACQRSPRQQGPQKLVY